MWRSEDDIAKDLATLNDFGIPGDEEPYKFLYSFGRGSKIKQKKKTPEKFIDSRTGEVINVKDALLDVPDTFYKNKGRGSLLGTYSKSKSQLRQQLRLARPLGSGDEAVESYYRRNKPVKKADNPINSGGSEIATKNQGIASENTSSDSSTYKTRLRVKATRNSSLQSNALMRNLLSKVEADPNIKFINDNCSINTNSNYFSTNIGFNVEHSGHSKFKEEKNATVNSQEVFVAGEQNETKESEKRYGIRDQKTEGENIGHENFKIKMSEEEENELTWKSILEKKNENEVGFCDDSEKEESHTEKNTVCKKKFNVIDNIDSETMNDFSQFSNCMNELSIYDGLIAVPFLCNENDFPPLRRN